MTATGFRIEEEDHSDSYSSDEEEDYVSDSSEEE